MNSPKFKFDELLNKDEICNLKSEADFLRKAVSRNEKVVVYGRRNMGKTSLLKNVIAEEFAAKHPEAFIMFADFMEVKSIESIENRIQTAFSEAFSKSFPAKNFIKALQKFLAGIKPIVEIDPVSGATSLRLSSQDSSGPPSMSKLFNIIREKISKEKETLIILDEFQDISLVPEAAGLLREEFQKFKNTPILILGSKKHLLSRMFAMPNAPFADFGVDLEFKPIPYEEYHMYILERLKPSKLTITLEVSRYLQDQLLRLPEPINIVGSYIVNNHQNREVTPEIIQESIVEIIASRRERFESLMATLSNSEEKVLVAFSRKGPVKEVTGVDFLSSVSLSHGTVRTVVLKLEDKGILERTENGLAIANPLLHSFLVRFR